MHVLLWSIIWNYVKQVKTIDGVCQLTDYKTNIFQVTNSKFSWILKSYFEGYKFIYWFDFSYLTTQ